MAAMKIWMVRADGGTLTDAFLKQKCVAIGWSDLGFLPGGSTWETIDEKYGKAYPDHAKMKRAINVGQILRFVSEIEDGDVVLTPGPERTMLAGKVHGGTEWREKGPFPLCRPVDWSIGTFKRADATIPLQYSLRSSQTVFRVWHDEEVLHLLKLGPPPKARETAIGEDHLEVIRTRLTALHATEFELLVSYVLRSLGFESQQETGRPGDKGIDYKGELEVFGVATIKLHVQVKRYAYGKVKDREIRDLRGTLDSDQQGCFITLSGFEKNAQGEADNEKRGRIRTIDGPRFVELLTLQYEKVIDIARTEGNQAMLDVLQFRKVLVPA